MKKIILILSLFLCMIAVASAATLIIKETVKPDIKATFNETVAIDSANLTYIADNTNIPLINRTTDNKIFFFKPNYSLSNGFYFFNVTAQDRIGNPKIFRENIIVMVNETAIGFISPRLGISTTPTYDIILGTSRPANCSWSFQDGKTYEQSTPLERVTNYQHKLKDFVGDNIDLREDSGLRPLYVKCKDSLGRILSAQLDTGYDPTPPNIDKITIVPNPVDMYPPKTTITVLVNDKSVCYLGGTIFSGEDSNDVNTYRFQSVQKINYTPPNADANGNYNYNILCKNKADVSASKSETVIVNLKPKLAITVVQPGPYLGGVKVRYEIRVNQLPADCVATLNPGDNLTHLGSNAADPYKFFSEGPGGLKVGTRYVVTFVCTGGISGSDRADAQQNFIVDLTAPSKPIINATACAKDKLSLAFLSKDNESCPGKCNVYNYTVYGQNLRINWTLSSSNVIELTGLTLNKSVQAYTVDAYAVNGAKMYSAKSTTTFKLNQNATACLEKVAPTLSFEVNNSLFGGKNVKIKCFDAGTGCQESTIKFELSETENCTPRRLGSLVIMSRPQWLCAEAMDKAQNRGTLSKYIEFVGVGSTCSNRFKDGKETDIDCGGDCSGCGIGKICAINKDCAENYCVASKCKKPYCNDTIQNGFESDIDCGGTSCTRCAVNKKCNSNPDCITNFCNPQNKCDVTLCTDAIKNGFESDVDCGGKDCNTCEDGKKCSANSDCKSGLCELGSCGKGAKTWEEWAAENNIDPEDKNGDADEDGLTNYQEYLEGTDPNKADTDGDGYNDGDEVAAGTNPLDPSDYPSTAFYRYGLLAIALLILIIGLIFMYYFKIDAAISLNLIIIGAAALFFVLIDWLLFKLPKSVLVILSLAAIGASGYFFWKDQSVVLGKLTGKSKINVAQRQVNLKEQSQVVLQSPKEERKLTKEEMEATKTMVDMIRKQKSEREAKREKLFESFGKEIKKSEKTAEKPLEKLSKLEHIRKIAKVEKPVIKEKTSFDKLAEVSKGKEIERLSKLSDENSVEKLTKLAKSKYNDVFGKLPKSEKGFEELSELDKKRLLKKVKKLTK